MQAHKARVDPEEPALEAGAPDRQTHLPLSSPRCSLQDRDSAVPPTNGAAAPF